MGNVLIADGDRASRDLLVQALSSMDCQVEFVPGGEEVFWRVSSGAVDVLMVEVHLSDLPAWHLVPRVHQLDPDLPVIAMTADDSWETSKRVRIEGGPVFFYALKPLHLPEIRAVVCSAIQWRQKHRRPPLGQSVPYSLRGTERPGRGTPFQVDSDV